MKLAMYAIRHIPSGGYLPKPQGRNGRGGSHMEPVVFDGRGARSQKLLPRLWATETAAKIALSTWLHGKVTCRRYGGYDNYQEYYNYIKVPTRIREDMEIVPVIVDLP